MTSSLQHRPAASRLALNPIALAALLALSTAPLAAQAGTSTWSGGAPLSFNGDWSTSNNWLNQAVPQSAFDTDLVFGATTSGGTGRTTANNNFAALFMLRTLTFTSAAPAYTLTGNSLNLGSGGIVQNSTAAQTVNNTLNLTASQTWSFASGAGALNIGQDLNVGAGAALSLASGRVNLTNIAAVLNVNGISASTATLNVSGTAALSTGTVYVSSGTVNLSGNASSLSAGQTFIGRSGSGTFNQSGGSFTTNGNTLYLGNFTGASGTYNLSGGSLTTGRTQISDDANTSVFTQSGGTHTTTTLSLTGDNATSQGIYNLDGGRLVAGMVTSGDGGVSGNSTFNFNGGTLQAGAAGTSFMQGLTTANVQAGGARVDTAGFDVTIAQALVHDNTAGAAANDGGLTKLGAGTLTLTGTNTFNGSLNIAAGTLAVATESNLGSGSLVTVDGGGKLLFTGNATLSRTYNLGVSTLAVGSGNTLTLGGATLNGGFLSGPGTQVLANGATLNAVTSLANSTLTQGSGAATSNNSTIRGTLTQTGGSLALNNGFVSTSGRLSVGGTVNATGTEILGVTTITAGGTLANSGSSLYLSGGSRTTINAGGTLSTATGTAIELNGSQLVNNGTQRGVLDINYGSLAKGSGSFGTINIADGGKFSPGNSPGTATVENITFASGGRYDFELNTANPRFGTDSDLLIVTDTLFVTAGTTSNSIFTLAIDSLNQANQPSALTDFDSSRSHRYLLVDANNVSGFAGAKFNIDTSGFLNSLNGGSFSVSLNGNDVYLDFNPVAAAVPEPSSWVMLLVAGAMGAGVQARRRRVSQT